MMEIIESYLQHMKLKYNISAAMVTGSYVTGQMGPRSDIDIFFIGTEEYQSIRGREYFDGIEFEYFISPEWKYYDRLRADTTSMRIYSTAKIILDPENRLGKIQQTALKKVQEYACEISIESRKDYKFWLETISNDGEDLYDRGNYRDFLFFTGCNLRGMGDLLCRISNTLPVYGKYGVTELFEADKTYGVKLEEFLMADIKNQDKKKNWVSLCNYLKDQLGEMDITNYESFENL